MHRTRRQLVPVFLLFTLVGAQMPAQAQFGDLGKKLKQKVEQRIERKTDKAMEDGLDKVECAATDQECFEQAKAEGKEVTTVDNPAPSKSGQPAPLKSGQGASRAAESRACPGPREASAPRSIRRSPSDRS